MEGQFLSSKNPIESPLRPWLITVSIMLATIMQVLDMTIATIALPHIQGSLSTNQEQISWVMTSYIISVAIMTPPLGYLAGRFGRRQMFIVSVVGFTLTSMLCGASTSLPQIIFFRILQGAFGAGLVPYSQALLLDTFPREKHGEAMAFWGMGVMVAPILGPTLGGYLTDLYSWRWIFYINLPVGILALLGIIAFVPETKKEEINRFDWLGFILLSISIGTLQLARDRGHLLDWFSSPEIILEITISVLCFYLFLVQMFTSSKPFFNPSIFKDSYFVGGLSYMFVVSLVLIASMLLLPPFLQNLKGYPVVTTGLVLAPRGIGTMVAMLIVARLVNQIDPRFLIQAGLLIISFSFWLMSKFSIEVGIWEVVNAGIVQGVGLGLYFVPLSVMTFTTLDSKYRNEASALYSLARNIGSGIGISFAVTLLVRHTQINRSTLVEHVTPFNTVLEFGRYVRFANLKSRNYAPSGSYCVL